MRRLLLGPANLRPPGGLWLALLAGCSSGGSTSTRSQGAEEPTTLADPNADVGPGDSAPAPPAATILAPLTDDVRRLQGFVHGMEMAHKSGSSDAGTYIVHEAISTGTNSLWTFQAAAGGHLLRNGWAKRCIGVNGKSSAPLAPAILTDCAADDPSQTWLGEGRIDSLVLRNLQSRLCLGVEEESAARGARLVQSDCTGAASQAWNASTKEGRVDARKVAWVIDDDIQLTHVSLDQIVAPGPTVKEFLQASTQLVPHPNSTTFQPIGYAYVGPTLTWGGNCPAAAQPPAFSSWWTSGQYYRNNAMAGGDPCQSGPVLAVTSGSSVHVEMTLNGTVWEQKITHSKNNQTVTFSKDLKGQYQALLIVKINASEASLKVAPDQVLKNISLTVDKEDPGLCTPFTVGVDDLVEAGTMSADRRTCSVPMITLRGPAAP